MVRGVTTGYNFWTVFRDFPYFPVQWSNEALRFSTVDLLAYRVPKCVGISRKVVYLWRMAYRRQQIIFWSYREGIETSSTVLKSSPCHVCKWVIRGLKVGKSEGGRESRSALSQAK